MNIHYIIAHNKIFDFIAFFYSTDITDNYINLLNIFNIKENKNSWNITESIIFNEDIDNFTYDRIENIIKSSFIYFNGYKKLTSDIIKIKYLNNIDGGKYYIFVNPDNYEKIISYINDEKFINFYTYNSANTIEIKQITIKNNKFVRLIHYNINGKICKFENINDFNSICPTSIDPEIFIKLNKFECQLIHFIYFLIIPNDFAFNIININEVQDKIKIIKENIDNKYKEIDEDLD